MEEKDIIDKFIKIENEHNFFKYQILGVNFWQYYRFSTYLQIIDLKEKTKKSHFTISKKKKLLYYIKNLFSSLIFHNPFILKKVDFILFNHSRRIFNNQNGVWEEPYTDEFIKQNKSKKYYIFEASNNGIHHKNVLFKNNIKYLDLLQIISSFYVFLCLKFKKIGSDKLYPAIQIKNILKKEFGFNIEIKKLDYYIFYIKIMEKLLRFVIKKTDPKIIYEVVYYSMNNLILNKIASDIDITTIEFQHGTMGKYHPAYNYFSSKSYDFLPKKIYFFNKFWKNNNRMPLLEKDKIIYGNPYLRKMASLYKNKIIKKSNSVKNILFISQGSIGNKIVEQAILLSKIIERDKYHIQYKLHPSEYLDWKIRYPHLSNIKNIEVIYDNNIHLYQLFANATIQIGVYSTSIYEGLEFNLETYILKEYGWKYMENLIEVGKAKLLNNVLELKLEEVFE